jgi:hypothetical protein
LEENPASIPSYGENAERADALSEDLEIPPAFICPLSQCIMTEPVYDPNTGTRFEKEWILVELKRSGKNPCTRTDLMQSDLISDNELQKAIEAFLEDHERQSTPSLR